MARVAVTLSRRGQVEWLSWAPLGAAILHIVEEFVWPGGFLPWYRNYRPDIAASLTPRFAMSINSLLLVGCLGAALNWSTPQGLALWLTMVGILLSNVGFHVRATWQTRRYAPGAITAVLLYLPLGVFGYWHLVHRGLASVGTALIALLVGGSYPLWSWLNHHRRANRARAA